MEGYLPVSRRFFLHELWDEPRVFSRAEAWIDLVQSASFQAGKRISRGKVIDLNRGELIGALRYLANRWQWSPMKVDRFLDYLENETMIQRETRQGETLIKLCKFEAYNPMQIENETVTRRETGRPRDSDETVTRQNKERNKGRRKSDLTSDGADDKKDDRFTGVIKGYTDSYAEVFGEKYVFNGGKDGTAVSRFLHIVPADVSAEKIVGVMRQAMEKTLQDPFAQACKASRNLCSFCDRWNDIRPELIAKNGHKPTNGRQVYIP